MRMPVLKFFRPEAISLHLDTRDRAAALSALSQLAVRMDETLNAETVHMAVAQREDAMGTSLGDGIAVPHARLPGLKEPVIIMARATTGIDWNAPDGLPVRLIFLLLTSVDAAGQQIRILGAIAKALKNDQTRDMLLEAQTPAAYHDILQRAMQASGPEYPPAVEPAQP